MAREAPGGLIPDRSARQRQRDAALARVGRVRGATILGAGGLTVALAGVVSAVAPGRTLGAKVKVATAAVAPRRSIATSPRMPPLAPPAQLGLAAPGQAPQSAPAQPAPPSPSPSVQPAAPAPSSGGAVVSGGS